MTEFGLVISGVPEARAVLQAFADSRKKMGPSFAGENQCNGGLRHSKTLRECSLCNSSNAIQVMDFHDLRLSQFCCRYGPSFLLHIPHVFSMSTQPKMGGVHTKRIVATRAVVADLKAIGDWPEVNFPGYDVSTGGIVPDRSTDLPIAMTISRSGPQPTRATFRFNDRIVFTDLEPEPRGNREFGMRPMANQTAVLTAPSSNSRRPNWKRFTAMEAGTLNLCHEITPDGAVGSGVTAPRPYHYTQFVGIYDA